MAKFHGVIGYGSTSETKPGVFTEIITEREYYGDLLHSNSRIQTSSDTVNDSITIANEISIVADPFAKQNFYSMKYVQYAGAKWKITKVEPLYPRIILTTGGVYNGH